MLTNNRNTLKHIYIKTFCPYFKRVKVRICFISILSTQNAVLGANKNIKNKYG